MWLSPCDEPSEPGIQRPITVSAPRQLDFTQDSVAGLASVRKQEDPVDPQLSELVGAPFGVAPLEYRPCCENSIEHESPVPFLLVGFVASNVSTRTL